MHRISARTGLLLLGCLACAPAGAHPHVWVEARSEVVLDEGRGLVGMRVSWTFDPDYSAFAVLNLDSKRDGVPDPDKLAAIARERVAALAETGYFVQAKLNGRPLAFAPPGDARAEYRDGRLTLSFTLAPSAPLGAVRTLVVTTADPDFYVAFGLAPGPEPVRLVGASSCLLKVTRPAKEAQVGEQLIPDAEATARPAAAAATGADYIGRALVACP
ncbi:DUF1007 family protein [Methylobacterium sp. ID0610]|uniref:DUF1007 family protein n=1 Tax=Methylobacterium carpenticola TaxID=3344827 RepID=UPI0036CCF232